MMLSMFESARLCLATAESDFGSGQSPAAAQSATQGPDSTSDQGQMPTTPAVPVRQHKRLAMPKGK